MPRRKKTHSAGAGHHGLLQAIEAQYLTALKFSREQLDKRIRALEDLLPAGASAASTGAASKPGPKTKSGHAAAKPRNYELLKAKLTRPMTMKEILSALNLKPKQIGNIQQMMGKYKGLLKSDGKRPATYTFDASR